MFGPKTGYFDWPICLQLGFSLYTINFCHTDGLKSQVIALTTLINLLEIYEASNLCHFCTKRADVGKKKGGGYIQTTYIIHLKSAGVLVPMLLLAILKIVGIQFLCDYFLQLISKTILRVFFISE